MVNPGRASQRDASGSVQVHPLLIAFLVIVIGLVVYLQIQSYAAMKGVTGAAVAAPQQSPAAPASTRMSMSPFDTDLAHQMMDKDGDGRCDTCGMPVDMCISSGQLECTMTASGGIGLLGSGHTHADWKVFINSKEFDWSPYVDLHERQMQGDSSIKMTSAFIHLHPEKNQPAGAVLHMHATGVPLWLIFQSLGMKLTKECLEVSPTQQYCANASHSLKFFVNGKSIEDASAYVFQEGDKLLISYGPQQEDVSSQLASITNFSKEEHEEAKA